MRLKGQKYFDWEHTVWLEQEEQQLLYAGTDQNLGTGDHKPSHSMCPGECPHSPAAGSQVTWALSFHSGLFCITGKDGLGIFLDLGLLAWKNNGSSRGYEEGNMGWGVALRFPQAHWAWRSTWKQWRLLRVNAGNKLSLLGDTGKWMLQSWLGRS